MGPFVVIVQLLLESYIHRPELVSVIKKKEL